MAHGADFSVYLYLVDGIIGNQFFKRTRMFATSEQVITLMEKATMGMEELTDFLKDPVADAQKLACLQYSPRRRSRWTSSLK